MTNTARQAAGAIHIYMMELEELLKAIESVERASNAFRTINPHKNVEADTYGDILDMLKKKKDLNEQRLINLKEKLTMEMA
jgi:hypothetical protein